MDPEIKDPLRARLRRVEGQVGALCRMVEQDADCVDVLLQISAAQGALGRVGEILLGSHIETCVTAAFRDGKTDERRQKIDELMKVFTRYGRVATR